MGILGSLECCNKTDCHDVVLVFLFFFSWHKGGLCFSWFYAISYMRLGGDLCYRGFVILKKQTKDPQRTMASLRTIGEERGSFT